MIRILSLIAFLVLGLHGDTLIGKWVSKNPQGGVYLTFLSDSQLIYDGDRVQYVRKKNVIRVAGDYGYVDYPYTLKKDTLRISFPEGYQLNFSRIKNVKLTKNSGGLRGKFCNYSSSLNGGYSSTRWVIFDGRGNLQTGSGASYSGADGSYSGDGADARGRYRLENSNIIIDTDGGYHYVGAVIERFGNGRISALKINGLIYARTLCD